MEEINKEEISKNSEIKTTEIREESSTNTGSEKREFRPRNPRQIGRASCRERV